MGPGAKAVDNAVIILFVLRRSGGGERKLEYKKVCYL